MNAPGPPGALVTDDNGLNYQAARPLQRCTGFVAVVQVRCRDGTRAAAALRRDALEIHTEGDVCFLFDLEGRFIRRSTRNEYHFRGCSHQGSSARKGPGGFHRERFARVELDRLCGEAWEAARKVADAVGDVGATRRYYPATPEARQALSWILARTVEWTPERLAAEAERFAAVYQPVPVLPPDHYSSLVLQATEGCSFNTCTFCRLYRGIPFRIRDSGEFERHVRGVLDFHGEGLRRMSRIFIGQANALAAPQARIEDWLRVLARHVELPVGPGRVAASWGAGAKFRFLGIGAFLDGFTGLKKSVEDYVRLRRLGLERVYLGVETGSDPLLRWLRKPATTEGMRETIRRLQRAGIHTDVILLVGAGGSHWAREHVRESLAFLASAPLGRGDHVHLSELIAYADTPYPQLMRDRGSLALSEASLAEQRDLLRRGARELGLKAVPYRVEPFIY